MKKVEFVGWMPKTERLRFVKEIENPAYPKICLPVVYAEKGSAADWFPKDWPPRKVKVTIEELP